MDASSKLPKASAITRRRSIKSRCRLKDSKAAQNSAALTRFACDRGHRVPEELGMFIDGVFENSFLVAVGSEPLRAILFIHHRADAIALHALGPQERHVGGARLHQRHGRDIID